MLNRIGTNPKVKLNMGKTSMRGTIRNQHARCIFVNYIQMYLASWDAENEETNVEGVKILCHLRAKYSGQVYLPPTSSEISPTRSPINRGVRT